MESQQPGRRPRHPWRRPSGATSLLVALALLAGAVGVAGASEVELLEPAAIEDVEHAWTTTGSIYQLEVAAPTGSGHLLVAHVMSVGAIQPPDPGWQILNQQVGVRTSTVLYKIADPATEPASYTFTDLTQRGRFGIGMARIAGADLDDPFGATAGAIFPGTNATTYPTPSVEVTGDTRLLLRLWGTHSVKSLQPPTDHVTWWSFGSSSLGRPGLAMASRTADTTPSGPANATGQDSTAERYGHTLAIRSDPNRTDPSVRLMFTGDSVTGGTGGGEGAVDSYRYRLYQHFEASGFEWAPVGPFHGVSHESVEPSIGYGAWPLDYTAHAGRNGWTAAEVAAAVGQWVGTRQPDVILAFPAFNFQEDVTRQDFERFIDDARAAKADVKILFGLPYYASPFSIADTDAYRSNLIEVVAGRDHPDSPLRLVDMQIGWDRDLHAKGGNENRYPSDPAGNLRLAMRWADALHRHWGIGASWPVASVPSLQLQDATITWAFDDRADAWEIEGDGEVIATLASVAGQTQTYTAPGAGNYRVRGVRFAATPGEPGEYHGPWSSTLAVPG